MKNDIRKSVNTLFSNKYAVAVLIFVVWLAIIDNDRIPRRISLRMSVESLEKQKKQLQEEIQEDNRKMEELRNVKTLEKFAREEYYMKSPDEVVFIVK